MSDTNTAVHGTRSGTLTGATLGFFIGFAAVSLFGPTARLLKDAMGLDPLLVGLMVATPSLTGSLLRIPFGAWVDSDGGRKPILVLLLLSAVGMAGLLVLLSAYSVQGLTLRQFPLVLALGMLTGCGIAVFAAGIGQVSYWYPQSRQGTALAVYAGLGNVAPGLFALLVPLLVVAMGLAWTYAAWLALLLAGVLCYALLASNAPYFQLRHRHHAVAQSEAIRLARAAGEELFPSSGTWHGLLATIRVRHTWALVFFYFTSFGGFLALTAWLPTYWNDHFGLGLATAGALTMVYSVLTSILRVPGGVITDRVGGERTVAGAFLVMLAGAALLALVPASLNVAVVASVILAAGMGVANAAVFKLVPRYLGAVGGGAGAGWVGGLGAFGGFVLPPVLGWLVQAFGPEAGYRLGFALFGALAAGCLVLVALKPALAPARTAGPFPVRCPLHGESAEIWVQAHSGEMPPVRLVRCSLLADGSACIGHCLESLPADAAD